VAETEIRKEEICSNPKREWVLKLVSEATSSGFRSILTYDLPNSARVLRPKVARLRNPARSWGGSFRLLR
jgi:hypothetical protein